MKLGGARLGARGRQMKPDAKVAFLGLCQVETLSRQKILNLNIDPERLVAGSHTRQPWEPIRLHLS